MSQPYDVIVIGAGVSELVAANYLARAGQRVLVLEDREVLGGTHVTEETVPGFRFDTCASDIGFLNPQIIQDLELRKHGLEILSVESGVFSPVGNGRRDGLLLQEGADTVASIARFSPADASRWVSFSERIAGLAGFLWSLYCEAPPLPTSKERKDLLALLGVGRRLRGLGKVEMVEFMRTVPMPVADFLDNWFESDALKGALGPAGVSHQVGGHGLRDAPSPCGTASLRAPLKNGRAGRGRHAGGRARPRVRREGRRTPHGSGSEAGFGPRRTGEGSRDTGWGRNISRSHRVWRRSEAHVPGVGGSGPLRS
jgi:phytoene dehydrogenase-like protein